ncbi:SigE family RNA polymerase sigma factor [uncultured Jatrophihabitans sp.]|uniref:SigE family RNA polymerase sigma factor n=1 Tax=uncultured Jatrophihabitans sp. TaxID=1610747 RepID=UPI0035CBF749
MSAETRFADFVRANTEALVRTAYLLTGSSHGAEELVQDTLVRLYPKWGRVESADVPLAYVRRSLTNGFLNQRRRASSRDIVTDSVPERPGERSDEDDLVDRDEVWALLQTLGHRQRAALVLRYYQGFDEAQIADALGCRPRTVRSLVSRGLATLRQTVSTDGGRTS